jgi:hypothetical protein
MCLCVQEEQELTNSGVFQVRKSKLRAYVMRDPTFEQCMRRSMVPQGWRDEVTEEQLSEYRRLFHV